MAATVLPSTTNGEWLRISGTIQEVLDELADQHIHAKNLIYWTSGAVNAVAVVCRMK